MTHLEVLALVLVERAVPARVVAPDDGAEAEVPRAQRVLRQPPRQRQLVRLGGGVPDLIEYNIH